MAKFNILGPLAKGDLRLAERDGHLYLFDHSGSTPDHTDDGPCRLLTDEPFEISARNVYCRVHAERTGSASGTAMSHAALVALLKHLRGRGFCTLHFKFDPDLAALRELLAQFPWAEPPVKS